MTVVVFIGSTLSVTEARAELDAIYLPPAAEGDVYRVALDRPQIVGIVDGYFEAEPAVWHKEILAAMAEGIHVFGSASMGALRAAELAAFGMEGVGRIFESFRDGRLQGDDEVAVVHGPAESGYVPLTDAMVNIRATLEQAAAVGVVSSHTAAELEAIAKRTFYKDRMFGRLLESGRAAGLAQTELDALGKWLQQGKVDQKRLDALAMLRAIRGRLADGLPPKRVTYHFEHTRFWEQASRAAAARGRLIGDHGVGRDAVVEEAKIEIDAYRRAGKAALARCLAANEARRLDKRATAAEIRETADRIRRDRRLEEVPDLQRWLRENELDEASHADLVTRQVLVEWIGKILESSMVHEISDELRLSGDYPRLACRARDKEYRLARIGAQRSPSAMHNLTEEELLRWYAAHRGVAADSLVDLAASLGFSDVAELQRALLREYFFVTYPRGCPGGEAPARAQDDSVVGNSDLAGQSERQGALHTG